MDALPSLGTAISDIVKPTHNVYEPLLRSQAAQIKSTKCETFEYGPDPRQKLDLYSPSSSPADLPRVLVFMYGGGLVFGDKIIQNQFDGLVYANLGHYFAEKLGSKVAIVDYRLMRHGAKYPSGGEDLSLAVEWVMQKLKPDSNLPLQFFLMGNSAGGVHTATFLLARQFEDVRSRLLKPGRQDWAILRGCILVSVPYHFENAHASRSEILQSYYGNEIRKHCPLGLLEDTHTVNNLPVLVLHGELDPKDEILEPHENFVKEWRRHECEGSRLVVEQMKGHNHISPVLGVGTGLSREEEWARGVVCFIDAHSDTVSMSKSS